MSKSRSESRVQIPLTQFFIPKAPVPQAAPAFKRKKRERQAPLSILHFFKPTSYAAKISRLETSIKAAQSAVPEAGIVVSFREDGDGRGACFDHLSLQTITRKHTKIAKSSYQTLNAWDAHNQRVTYHLPLVPQGLPAEWSGTTDDGGLLYLPGVASQVYKTMDYQTRKRFEFDLIKKARLWGQPILGVCGGSWVLWEQFGGTITDVAEHNYRAGMPRVSDTTGKIGHNVLIHDIALKPEGLTLRAALAAHTLVEKRLPVNSVHSYAADKVMVPDELIVAATSLQNEDMAPWSAHAKADMGKVKMRPEEDSIEAFETKHGAPILGVQWHPEAFSHTHSKLHFAQHQQHLIQYMSDAGQAYLNRQVMIRQFKTLMLPDCSRHRVLKLSDHLSYHHQVCKKTSKGLTQFSIYKLQKGPCLRHIREAEQEIEYKEMFLQEKGFILRS